MKRRKFIQKTAAAAVALPVLNGLSMSAIAEGSYLHQLYISNSAADHILVVIQMSGGNDGLNMVIPLDQYSNYYNARSNIAIAQNNVLALTGTAATGLHPSLTGLRDLYNAGQVNIVQSVGYPTPNFSHFRATDIYMTASDQNQYLTDGWLGRYMNVDYPGYPNGYPNPTTPHPLGIQYGSGTSLIMLGPVYEMGVTIGDPNNVITDGGVSGDPAPATPAGDKLTYVRSISAQSDAYGIAIKTAYNATSGNPGTYPSGNSLADQLKTTARLINGGLKTKIYCCNIGGFDLHSNATSVGDTSSGAHATLLQKLGDAIKAFHADLVLMGKDNNVIGMTFSEFGRRIKSNASGGTDHGTAYPMILFGTQVTGGITGTNPVLPAVAGVNDNIAMQTDFRSIYSSLLKRWLCENDTNTLAIMLQTFPQPNICSNAECTGPVAHEATSLIHNYPNPVTSSTVVEYKTDGGHTLLRLIGPNGLVIFTIMEKIFNGPATGTETVDMSSLHTGIYYIHFQNGTNSQMKPVIKVR